jgi:GNAT superfamily N-acetyltransferase
MTIRELTMEADILQAFPLMRQLRDRIRPETFLDEIRRRQKEGYRLFGGFEGGQLVALGGVRRTRTLARGEHLFVDDLVTDETARRHGHGRELIAWLADRTREENLARIDLDSRLTAKGFYEQLGFTFHTAIPCSIDVKDVRGKT